MSITESRRTYSKDACGVWRPDPLNYHPIRKHLHFDPSPVAGNIPFYADVIKNPKCENTQACIDFWNEQFDYCVNGYTTAGVFIPGRYYFMLNFEQFKGVFGDRIYPWFIDVQYEFFLTVEWVKKNKWMGIIAPKARRKGLSEMGHSILDHGVRFINGYKGGICAGLSTYVDGFKTKMDTAAQEIHPALKLSTLTDNSREIEYGYRIRNILGQIQDEGSRAKILMDTMYDDPKKFEGEYFNDVIYEESGEFPLLESTVESVLPALMMGSEIGGTSYIYGTGGNILSSSKGFRKMYDQSDSLKLARFEVLGQRMVYPFFGISQKAKDDILKRNNKKITQDTPAFEGWKDYEKVGCEDLSRADQWIIEEDQRYQALDDQKKLREHRQNFPRNVEDIFTSAGKNNFNSDILYFALNTTMQEEPLYEKVVMEFEKVKDGFGVYILKHPLSVTVRPWKESDPDWKVIYLMKGQGPSLIRNMDTGGLDAYEADKSDTSGSKEGITVFRDFRYAPQLCPMNEKTAILPICGYYERPPKRELAFEMGLKISVYFNLIRDMMVSAEHQSCLEYFQKNEGAKYLSLRPRSMDAPGGKQVHQYGVKMNVFSKPRALELAHDWVEKWGHLLRFEPLIRDFLAYDEENIGTDWDLGDSAINALVRIHDRNVKPPDAPPLEGEEKNSGIATNREIIYSYDQNGNFKMKILPKAHSRTPRKAREIEPEEDYIIC